MPITKHGMSNTPTHIAWKDMRQRCLNKKNPDYKYYGGRDITICERWNIFINFYEDMGARPEGLSLDRINNELGYYKENCRWTNQKNQLSNRRIRKDSIYLESLIGKKFNKWFIKSIIYVEKYKQRYCLCICDCGNTTNLHYSSLLKEKSKSCGKCRITKKLVKSWKINSKNQVLY